MNPSLYFMAVVAATSAAMAPASSAYPMCTRVRIDTYTRTQPRDRLSGGSRRDRGLAARSGGRQRAIRDL
ncbi:hypothetical protein GCM10010515_47940 [Streptomyces fructofermentans]|uniref:Secreted protein n=1 Tax=Streptomyces fructofermentans TaxID=152141 RepID=A0A918NI53_9ACTN|nr:hypothetical protein GCM10010515_47940 [Streptomyces fructofermentans]